MIFSGHHYRLLFSVSCIVIRVMLEYVLGWVLGSGICLYQEKLNHVNLVKEGITKTSPCNMQTIFSAVKKNMKISIEKKKNCSKH